MKRSFVVAAILVSAFAKETIAQGSPILIGVEAGATLANIVGENDEGTSSRTAPYAGINLVVQKPGSRLGFQTGLLLVSKGTSFNDDDFDSDIKLRYVEVPLLLRLSLPLQGAKIVPSLLLGGSVGIKQACKVSLAAGSVDSELDCDDSAFEGDLDVKTIDFGVSGGVEVAIPIGPRFFIAPTVRFTRGLNDITDTVGDEKAKNSAFQFGAVFRIRL